MVGIGSFWNNRHAFLHHRPGVSAITGHSMKKWIIATSPAPDFLSAHPELPPLAVRLLWNRGLRTQEQIDEFLNPDYLGDIHDPYLFKDMNKAVELIFAAIKNEVKIK